LKMFLDFSEVVEVILHSIRFGTVSMIRRG
jgi:hypothetical protein